MEADDASRPLGVVSSEGLGPRCRSETGDVMLCADAACGWRGRCVVAEPMEPGEERDCRHGQLARACDRCADAREIAELREALKKANEQAERFERHAVELVLIRGLPGSGKTTMARVLALVGYEHHEADQYFEREGGYQFDAAELPKAHAWCLDRAKDSMARGARCVVANTFTRHWEMQPYLDAAKAAGVPVRVIEAHGTWQNVHGVPADAIERMRARWAVIEA